MRKVLRDVTSQASEAVEAFRCNQRNRRRQSKSYMIFAETCQRRKSHWRVTRVFGRAFARAAAECFAAGDFKSGRRFFNGAFQFGGPPVHRVRLLQASLRLAVQMYRVDNHAAIWNLMEAVRRLAPANMEIEDIVAEFERAGVPVDRLSKPSFAKLAEALPALAAA